CEQARKRKIFLVCLAWPFKIARPAHRRFRVSCFRGCISLRYNRAMPKTAGFAATFATLRKVLKPYAKAYAVKIGRCGLRGLGGSCRFLHTLFSRSTQRARLQPSDQNARRQTSAQDVRIP